MVAEINSTVERRRSWSAEAKLRNMSEALEPGATMAAVADRNGVCRSQLYHWLRLARENRLPGVTISPPASPFVPVGIAPPEPSANRQSRSPEPAPDLRPMVSRRGRRERQVEVTLTNGRVIKVDEDIDPASLGAIIAALEGGMVITIPAGAIRFARSRWHALTRYLDDGRLEISNNATQNQIRPAAMSRKNWLFCGSDASDERATAFYTLVRTARLNGIEPGTWLTDVIARIGAHPINRLAELLPWNRQPPASHSDAD